MKPHHQANKPIVYFDGCCGFCSAFVKLLVKTSKARQNLNFMPYQAVTSSVPEELLLVTSTFTLEAGQAAVKVLDHAGGSFRLLAWVLQIIPDKLLDKLYYTLARNRFRWFGTTTCTVA